MMHTAGTVSTFANALMLTLSSVLLRTGEDKAVQYVLFRCVFVCAGVCACVCVQEILCLVVVGQDALQSGLLVLCQCSSQVERNCNHALEWEVGDTGGL